MAMPAMLATALLLLTGQDAAPSSQPWPTAEEVVAEINAARTDPQGYAQHLHLYRRQFEGDVINRPGRGPILALEGVASVDEAIAALEGQRPMGALIHDVAFDHAAATFVLEQGAAGTVGHVGAAGDDATARVRRYTDTQGAGENISYGEVTARDVVIQFLVDAGVPGRGHRNNIFSDYARVGAACGPHARYERMCVVDFGL
jgi:uncharacterized protein YkwD